MYRQSVLTVLAQNFVFCTVIALLLWQLVPSVGQYGFFNTFVHAQAIGNCIAIPTLAISRFAVKFGYATRWWSIFTIVLITPIGIYLGVVLAAWWLGPDAASYDVLADAEQLLITTATAVIASTAFYWHWSSRENVLRLELIASEERRRADTSRHVMLQAQLEPHMLFNTLANLRALITTDTDSAIDMLDRLDSFLRETLSSSQAATHTLQHEFKVLEDYLALMQIRLGKRLTFKLDLPDDCKELMIPSLLLQPLVENAIRHGIEPQIEGGLIVASARRKDRFLRLVIADTGVGISKKRALASSDLSLTSILSIRKPARSGFGMTNLRERLEQSYGDRAELNFESSETDSSLKGTRVTLRIPIKDFKQTDEQQAAPGSAATIASTSQSHGHL